MFLCWEWDFNAYIYFMLFIPNVKMFLVLRLYGYVRFNMVEFLYWEYYAAQTEYSCLRRTRWTYARTCNNVFLCVTCDVVYLTLWLPLQPCSFCVKCDVVVYLTLLFCSWYWYLTEIISTTSVERKRWKQSIIFVLLI